MGHEIGTSHKRSPFLYHLSQASRAGPRLNEWHLISVKTKGGVKIRMKIGRKVWMKIDGHTCQWPLGEENAKRNLRQLWWAGMIPLEIMEIITLDSA